MAVRLLVLTFAFVAAWHIFHGCIAISGLGLSEVYVQYSEHGREHDTISPSEPTTLAVSDRAGYSRWTISIPHDYEFPLQGEQYQELCKQGDSFKENISQQSRLVRAKDWRRKGSYYSPDSTFLDVDQAESIGVLQPGERNSIVPTCERSLTYVLDADDSSFGRSLLLLWLSYGLARKEGRAFFIDDTRWAYGRYSSFFALPPSPGCIQPPRHQIVPCPHSAKHLVTSAATSSWTFGSAFENEFMRSRQHGAEKSRQIFDLARAGYEDLFVMTGEDALYAASRLAKFKEDAHEHSGSVVGMHIRRGDLHPLEFQYSRDYLPLDRYASASRKLLRTQLLATLPHTHQDVDDFHKFLEYVHSPLLLGSDDPEIFDSTELKDAASPFVVQKAQERIQLATKATLDLASPAESLREPGSAYVKHVDENSGWEGGFYTSLFYALGKSRPSLSSTPQQDLTVPQETKRIRQLVGRAYLLDLAVLGESDGLVCAVSSATCRLLGVMMGWDALKEGRWMNVDDDRPWSWDGRVGS